MFKKFSIALLIVVVFFVLGFSITTYAKSDNPTSEPFTLLLKGQRTSFGGHATIFVGDDWHYLCLGVTRDCGSEPSRFYVPEGKYLVIRDVSVRAREAVPNSSDRCVATVFFENLVELNLGELDYLGSVRKSWYGGRTVYFVVPGGSEVLGRIEWSDYAGTQVDAAMTITGDMYTLP